MSNTNEKKPKVYAPGTSVKEYKFEDGGSVMRLSILVEKFAPFVKANKNERGYLNLTISPRKEIGAYGETHSVSLDTWQPSKDKASTQNKSTTPKKETASAVDSDVAF